MKITINTDDQYTETEIIVNCDRLGDDIDKLLAAIRTLDMKLTVYKDKRSMSLMPLMLSILRVPTNGLFFIPIRMCTKALSGSTSLKKNLSAVIF